MADAASPPRKKKLPFKPTALGRASAAPPTPTASSSISNVQATQDGDNDTDDLALFRRSREMAPRLAAELERRHKKKERLQRRDSGQRLSLGEKRPHEEDAERRSNDTPPTEEAIPSPAHGFQDSAGSLWDPPRTIDRSISDLVTPPPSKRSRNGITSSSNHSQQDSPIIDLSDSEARQPQASPSTRITRSQAKAPSVRQPNTSKPAPAPIVLDDSDTDTDTAPHAVSPTGLASTFPRPALEVLDDTPVDDEDEFSEYVAKAEAARARLQAQQRQKSAQPNLNNLSNSGPSASSPPEHAEILVTSTIPNSTPCKARVRFDQSLKLLRDSWAAKQRKNGLDIPEDAAIITWRRKRVYVSSTLLTLGLKPRGDGRIASTTNSFDGRSRSYSSNTYDGLSDDRTRVHFEAWTPAAFKEMELAEANRQNPPPTSSPGPASDGEEEEEVKLKVLLKARGLPNVGLTVRPATTAETLVTGFKAQIQALNPDVIPEGTAIHLYFDGEQLEEHITLEEADIADMDVIDVHLKPQ